MHAMSITADTSTPSSETACEHASSCEMYSLFNLAGTLAVWTTNYCNAEFTACKRYQTAARGEPVAKNLLPNGTRLRK